MDVLFAPDWRSGVPYQRLLSEALERLGIKVRYLSHYKRILPLARAIAAEPPDILHLHWPEAYFPPLKDGRDWFRRARFRFDLRLALRHTRLATTGHNLAPHNRSHESFATSNVEFAYRRSHIVFAHSEIAKQLITAKFHLNPARVTIIPHGDLATTLGAPLSPTEAREKLNLPTDKKIALIFGMVEPYKGQEEVIDWWRTANPAATLAIVGKPQNPEYAHHLTAKIGDAKNIIARLEWLTDETLGHWLSAADCTIFNYRQIFTSGAANLARSWGIPILLPERLNTVILDEPSPHIHRFRAFDDTFHAHLQAALTTPSSFAAAAPWREQTSWDRVAALTLEGYKAALATEVR